ncbi:FAD-binding domain-containing protein [Xylariaceae sp. FL0594]|nr:FAD-binding domain-containing protein [Xylariaceae sp. FL0594]
MARLSSLLAAGLGLLLSLTSVTAVPFPLDSDLTPPVTRPSISSEQARRELGPLLSRKATIWGPGDNAFVNDTRRYQTLNIPDVKVLVQPGDEGDIAKIVKYANRNSIPFMAMNHRHAYTASVGTFSGIQIDMSVLTDITIKPNKKTALFQGGTYDAQVIDYLWNRGFVTTTGSCGCVGMLGPGLGGGHGRYQGLYGLISDNFVNLNVVLADGSAVQVNEKSYPDLFWAMQGAGHNFGIVTSFELKIYPRKVDTWYYRNYIFSGDQLETLFTAVNKLYKNGIPGVFAGSEGLYFMNPDTDKNNASILYSFIYAGPAKDAAPYLAPFDRIPHLSRVEGNVPYPEIAGIKGTDVDSALCAPGRTHVKTTVNLLELNVTTHRQLYDLFNAKIHEKPQLSEAVLTVELYSTEGVKKASGQKNSAFSQRDENILTFFDVPNSEKYNLTSYARDWAAQTHALWNAGQPQRRPTTYVNYAAGGEKLEEMYGYDGQVPRLRALKKKYDPQNRFRFYNPIA